MAGDEGEKKQHSARSASTAHGVGRKGSSLPSLRPKGLTNPYTPSAAADPLPREAPPAPRTRYVFQRCLARGGMGEVWLSKDLRLNRDVAIKLVRAERAGEARVVNAVIHEARLTARVEHPNIVPVHDLGVTEDGRFFYTMKRVHGQSLSHVLRAQAKGDPGTIEEYSLSRLLQVLRQVCLAVAYVHSRGVLHRDLKPSNVMIGEYGEVMIIDWGLARLKVKKDGDDQPKKKTELVQGTPAYMAPEQAQYGLPQTDERSDVYSLGAILYQILTLRPPYRRKKGESLEVYLRRIVGNLPPPPTKVAPQRDIPRDLAELAMRCLSKTPAERVVDAKGLAQELDVHIEGKKAKARRDANAAIRVEQANRAVDRHNELRSRAAKIFARLKDITVEQDVEESSVESEDLLFQLEEEAKDVTRRVMEVHAEAVRHYHEALTYVPEHGEARAGLADLYWDRFLAAEDAGADADRVHYEALIRHMDEDRYLNRLEGRGTLVVETRPSGLEVEIATLVEKDREYQMEEPRPLGTTPTEQVQVAMGSHMLRITGPDGRRIDVPLHTGREEQLEVHVRMDLEVPEGLVFIPAGRCPYGPDLTIVNDLPDYAIGRHPVTVREYLEFIDELDAIDRFEAWQRLPRSERIPGHRWKRGEDGYYLDAPGLRIDPDFPVVGISHEDAHAYCQWLGEQRGRPCRLPTEAEWEKAARGPDGRVYPWGNSFVATFALMRMSRDTGAALEKIGAMEGDVSPYGVRDMAGTVREWCGGWYSEGVGQRPVRGGSWSDSADECLAIRRRGYHPALTADNLGFRVLMELD